MLIYPVGSLIQINCSSYYIIISTPLPSSILDYYTVYLVNQNIGRILIFSVSIFDHLLFIPNDPTTDKY